MFARRIVTVLALVVCCPGATRAVAQVTKLLPVDEAARDPGFLAFRSRLIRAVSDQDTTYLLGVLAPDIRNSLGNHGGPDEFREKWQFATGARHLWGTLRDILQHGGAFLADTLFMAPYTSAAWPRGIDAFEHYAIIARDVRVRSRPGPGASVLAVLSYDVVSSTNGHPQEPAPGWTEVVLADGRHGYVRTRFVRSATGYRAGFVKRAGRWYLRWLLAGD